LIDIPDSKERTFKINSKRRLGGHDIITLLTNDKVAYFAIQEGKIVQIGERDANFGHLESVKNTAGEKILVVNSAFEMFTLGYTLN
jgi:hypothetical protein